MEKLTKQEAIKLHRQMWNWIAGMTEGTRKFINKDDYFEAMGVTDEDRPDCDCYCCEYDIQQNGGGFVDRCKHCPLYWGSECHYVMCYDKKFPRDGEGVFARWVDTNNIEERAKLARKIANLEVR